MVAIMKMLKMLLLSSAYSVIVQLVQDFKNKEKVFGA